jgi:hypothetical protein
MKTLQFFFCAVLLGTTVETSGQRRLLPPRDVEIILPVSTNIFVQNPGVLVRTNFFAGTSTNRFGPTNLFAGRSTNLNIIAVTNSGTPRSSVLIGPVFPAPPTNLLTPTGRESGFEGLGPGPAPLVTDALGQIVTNSVSGSEVPSPAVPVTPPNATPLAPPRPPSIPQPTTPPLPGSENVPPPVPSSPNPTPPATAPLIPPGQPGSQPGAQSPAPTPPSPPPAAPGGTGAR